MHCFCLPLFCQSPRVVTTTFDWDIKVSWIRVIRPIHFVFTPVMATNLYEELDLPKDATADQSTIPFDLFRLQFV